MDLLLWTKLVGKLTVDGSCVLAPEFVYLHGNRFRSRAIVWGLFGTGDATGFHVAICKKRHCVSPGHLRMAASRVHFASVGRKAKPRSAKIPRVLPSKEDREAARREKRAQWRLQNRERLREQRRAYYWADPERHRAKCREYKEKNPHRASYSHQVLASPNAEEIKLRRASHSQLRRARQRGGRYEAISLRELIQRDHGICHLCGGGESADSWSMDHLKPVSQGGEHTWANVKLAHRLCNVRRGTRPLDP